MKLDYIILDSYMLNIDCCHFPLLGEIHKLLKGLVERYYAGAKVFPKTTHLTYMHILCHPKHCLILTIQYKRKRSGSVLSEVIAANILRGTEVLRTEAMVTQGCLYLRHFLLGDGSIPGESHSPVVNPVLHSSTVLC